ncbi:glycosyltransferase [Salipiger mangrovisoli]|uniref:Glycosyltransferase n=1 Tax=Salipiger mangrovisoli TaxID=2865933 RepID=A0ABR9X0H9_9RHOB|nr:glycosyltransferase family 2 protein [Salipiger mangrovisoli]MBE9637060.1 glycosyltransferase [Salipiger mangrovisoli]
MNIDLCICTFRREHITDTLRSVGALAVPEGVALRVIVVDNDDTDSARARVEAVAQTLPMPLRYIHAPGANISIARNAGLDAVEAEWAAFLDDDEIAAPDWLATMIARQRETGADGIFGPSRAVYGPGAPEWMKRGDFHSQYAAPRNGVVETGHTCNALLRWTATPWAAERFELARGKSGGEDTEFFFRLRSLGATYAIAEDAVVTEEVPEQRLSIGWLLRRRYRIGQSYSATAQSLPARARLFGTAGVKSAYCGARTLLALPNPERRTFWLMRGTMHAGVCAGCLALPERALYGGAPS